MAFCIAITGTIGAGKSLVGADLAESLQADLVKADDLARCLMEKGRQGYNSFVDCYGNAYLDAKGEIDRKKLRKAITLSTAIKKKLEELLHPPVKEEILKICSEKRSIGKHVIFEIPLLFEVGWQEHFDLIIAVYTDRTVNKKRLMDRDNIDEGYVEKLLNLQMSAEQKAELSDVVINNSKSYEETRAQLVALAGEIKEKNSKKMH